MATFTAPTQSGPARRSAKDPVLSAALEIARQAARAEAGEHLGEHLGFVLEGERLGSHYFATTQPGYQGWRWYVTLTRAPRSRTATITETGLLPGDGALMAPEWLPWADRLAPGDLGPSDRLPYNPDDERLETGYVATGDPDQDRVAIRELGLGRDRVMNAKALDAAANRWYSGPQGPGTSGSRSAGADCATCGFIVPLAGSLGQVFGVCANEWSPDDGKVVALEHGCGAHSETDVANNAGREWDQSEPLIDEEDVEVVEAPAPAVGSDDQSDSADGVGRGDQKEPADQAPQVNTVGGAEAGKPDDAEGGQVTEPAEPAEGDSKADARYSESDGGEGPSS